MILLDVQNAFKKIRDKGEQRSSRLTFDAIDNLTKSDLIDLWFLIEGEKITIELC